MHLKAKVMTTTGYARKPRTDENLASRRRLLNAMFNTLSKKNVCNKIYASPFANASDPLLERDENLNQEFLESLDNCNGLMQGKYYDEKVTPDNIF